MISYAVQTDGCDWTESITFAANVRRTVQPLEWNRQTDRQTQTGQRTLPLTLTREVIIAHIISNLEIFYGQGMSILHLY